MSPKTKDKYRYRKIWVDQWVGKKILTFLILKKVIAISQGNPTIAGYCNCGSHMTTSLTF